MQVSSQHMQLCMPFTNLSVIHCSTDFNSYGPKTIAKTTAHRHNGRLSAPTDPGLGVTPLYDVLGKPVFEIAA